MRVDKELGVIIQSWILYLKDIMRYSNNTKRAYITDLYYFIEFFNSHIGDVISIKILENLKLQDFRSWLAHQAKNHEGNAANKIARSFAAIKGFFKYLKLRDHCHNDEIAKVKIRPVKKPLPKSIKVEQILKLIQDHKAKSENWLTKRDTAIMMLLYGAGLRISEVMQLTINNITGNSVRVIGKGNKERIVPLLSEVKNAVLEYTDSCPYQEHDVLFYNSKGQPLTADAYRWHFRKLKLEMNLPDYTSTHSLRHSFATHILTNGGNIRVIQKLLGHESISTTQIYTKVDMSNIIAKYKSTHPSNK